MITKDVIVHSAYDRCEQDEAVGSEAIEIAVDTTINAILEHLNSEIAHYGSMGMKTVAAALGAITAEMRKDLQ